MKCTTTKVVPLFRYMKCTYNKCTTGCPIVQIYEMYNNKGCPIVQIYEMYDTRLSHCSDI